jgi:hypothetical protein
MKNLFIILLAWHTAFGETLYSTDFEEFNVGDNQWTADSAWGTDNTRRGVDFIDDLAFNQALGKTAGLGLNRPSRNRVRILTQTPHDHVTSGESIIEIETLISVKDSDNSYRDDFFFSIYNSSGVRLASIRIDNEDPAASGSNFGFWREDGLSQFDTESNFIHEELYDLFIIIDLASNTWSASINGSPLFENATFTNAETGPAINLAAVGFEWALTSKNPFLFGDNFLLVADLRIVSLAPDTSPEFKIEMNENLDPVLVWHGFAGPTYQIEYSDTLAPGSWKDDLPDSTFTTTELSKQFRFEPPANSLFKRFFRVAQSE